MGPSTHQCFITESGLVLTRPATGSITTWEDLTTRFLAQFFPPGRTAKLRNDILMFQQHHEESLSEAWTPGGKLRDRNAKESWALLEDLALYDNKSWNDPRDFAKPVKAIALPQDVPSTSDRRLIELKNQVQCLIKAHLALTQPTQVNKITTSCEICSGPYKPLLNMHPRVPMKQEVSGLVSNFMTSQDARLSKFEADFKQQQSDMTNKIDTVLKAITDGIVGALPGDTGSMMTQAKRIKEEEKDSPENIHFNPSTLADLSVAFITKKVLKFNSFFESLRLVPQSSDTKIVYTKGDDREVMFIQLIRKNDDSSEGELEEEWSTTTEGVRAEYFDIFPTRSELAYHKYLMCSPIPSIFLRNSIIMEGCPSNLKIPCNIGHVHVEKSYIDPNSPLNIMTQMMYNWIMRRKLDPRENSNRGVSNFIGRIKGMHVFVGNFTYIIDFMIVEDISSIIDPRLSQVVLGKPFVEISNMTHDPPEGVVRFTNGTDEVAYKMPQMIEQYNSLSDLEKEHTKSVYLRNKEDKRRGVEYVMIKILGFYKECLELRPEYVTGMDDEREVTKERVTLYLIRRSLEVLLESFIRRFLGGRFNQLSHVSSYYLRQTAEY
ncbi:MAK10-like protein [Tanacetum coccineum]|uniref:MAK10-like protein n=1 Tax=Tanacetum coccineum TaxID=301880 RepID=A0ABQ5A5D7_9ASTR